MCIFFVAGVDYIVTFESTNRDTMTTAQIIREAKKEIKKMVSPNEVLNFNFKGLDFVSVEMPSTCGVNETMVWDFFIDYTEGNEDIFTELEKHEFPNLIEKDSLTVKLI